MESTLNKFIKTEEETKFTNTPNYIKGIEVDENLELSEDAKFGHELAKNPIKWYEYFNSK